MSHNKPHAHHNLAQVVGDPLWRKLIVVRWSDQSDGGANIANIATETLAYEDVDDADVADARPLMELVTSRPGKAALDEVGVTEVRMSDVAHGQRGRIGWLFVTGHTLFLVVLHSAFEDDIPGEHLDDGRNAYTELLLKLIRSRHGARLHIGFSSRLARSRRNRLSLVTALGRYEWQLVIGGKLRDLDDPIIDSVEGGVEERHTKTFHEASGKGELDDLTENLYPRNDAGLPFTHRFRREVVNENGLTYERVIAKQVEPIADVAPVMQAIAPLIATGEPWVRVADVASRHPIRARHAKDVAYRTGRTMADLKWPETALRKMFTTYHDLFVTGKVRKRWHGKVQGGATYGGHGSPQRYSLEELRAMTPRQRKTAEKGFFEVELDWGRVMLPGPDGKATPWGVPMETWEAMAARYKREEMRPRRRGASTQHRDKKPLTGPHVWNAGSGSFAILGRRPTMYELVTRDAGVTGGWQKSTGLRTLATWRSEDYHKSVGDQLARLAEDLVDQSKPLTVAPDPRTRVDGGAQLRQEAERAREDAAQVLAQIEAVPELARLLAARGAHAEAVAQYDALPQLETRRESLLADAADLERRAARADAGVINDRMATANFGTLASVAAGLLAYPGQAPWQLHDACERLLSDYRVELVNDGLTARWSAVANVPLNDGTVGQHTIGGLVPNRMRSDAVLDPAVYESVARTWFTAPDDATLEELAERLGWRPSEVRRKVLGWLGGRGGVPKSLQMPVRIPSKGLRSALVDCPVAAVRHAVWGHLMPTEACVADYLSPEFRRHIAQVYGDEHFRWVNYWAADTHVHRRRLMELCSAHGPGAAVPVPDAAAALGVAERSVLDFSRNYKNNAAGAPAYPATFRRTGSGVDAARMCVGPIRCPHRDCEGKKAGRDGGWCTIVLRVPELAAWAVLCPDCRRVPDPLMASVRFPAGYLEEWVGPWGFQSGRGGDRGKRGTLARQAPGRTMPSEAISNENPALAQSAVTVGEPCATRHADRRSAPTSTTLLRS